LRNRYSNLSRLTIDVLSIPALSANCERMFSELGDLSEPRRRGIQPQLLAAIQCVRRWRRASMGGDDTSTKRGISDDDIDAVYNVCDWAGDDGEEED
jgi:hypothetical protein